MGNCGKLQFEYEFRIKILTVSYFHKSIGHYWFSALFDRLSFVLAVGF